MERKKILTNHARKKRNLENYGCVSKTDFSDDFMGLYSSLNS